jgi:hypothetical protein
MTQITQQIAKIGTNRRAIIARRAGGDTRVSDRNDLSCMDADLEGLRGLTGEATAAVAETRATVTAATASRQRAATALAAEDNAVAVLLTKRAVEGEGVLLDALRKLDVINKRLHRRPAFICSHETREMLRRLAIENQQLANEQNPTHPANFYRRTG